MKIIIAGGGTAGHITPGLAVVEELRVQIPDIETTWIGTPGRKEVDLVPRHHIPLRLIPLQGISRTISIQGLFRNASIAFRWAAGTPIRTASRLLKEIRPDFVLGTGGYVCAPVLIASWIAGIPNMILEQNSIPGLTVRLLARISGCVGTAYEMTGRSLTSHAEVIVFGNPVGRSVLGATPEEGIRRYGLSDTLKTLLVVGGSLGSETLNRAVVTFATEYLESSGFEDWQILHSTGQMKYESVVSTPIGSPRYHPQAYLYHPYEALAAADLVLCRGGAMTLAEITARGKPSIIVPWPGAVRNHQYFNARALEESGATCLVKEERLTGEVIAEIIRGFQTNPGRLEDMARLSRQLGKPDAACKICQHILSLVNH